MTSRRSELLLKKCNIQHFDKNKPVSLKYPPKSHTQVCQPNLTEHGDTFENEVEVESYSNTHFCRSTRVKKVLQSVH